LAHWLLAGSLTLGAGLTAGSGAEGPPQEARLESLLEEGFAALRREAPRPALKSFEKANRLAGGTSLRAHLGIAEASMRLGDYRRVVEHAERMLGLTEEVEAQVKAHGLIGLALLSLHHVYQGPIEGGFEARQADLRRAEQAWRTVLELSGGEANIARYNLAEALFAQRRLAEAHSQLDEFLARGGSLEETPGADTLKCFLDVEAEGTVHTVGGEVAPPQKLYAPPPQFTQSAREKGVQGVVILEAVIDTAGAVRCVRPFKALASGMTQATIDAVRQWRFTPATLGGKPVPVFYTVTVAYQRGRGF
jgi:TonB family protein